jgi:ubiquinone/menaquinone biosynthesis C-methylase UbiE
MVAAAPRRYAGERALSVTVSDVLHLPPADATFDAVTNGFPAGNVVDPPPASARWAVLRPGGAWSAWTHAHLGGASRLRTGSTDHVMPRSPVLSAQTAQRTATWRTRSSAFLMPTAGADPCGCGLREVARRLGFGSVALHTGVK